MGKVKTDEKSDNWNLESKCVVYSDRVEVHTPTLISPDIYDSLLILTKEAFIQCYKQWILGEEQEDGTK